MSKKMARPHIEFLFSQSLKWTGRDTPNSWEGFSCKILSEDAETNESSLIVEVPSNTEFTFTSKFQNELFILSGDISINSVGLYRDGYARVPSGAEFVLMSTSGAVILLFQNKSLDHSKSEEIIAIDTDTIPWSDEGLPGGVNYLSLKVKSLYRDENNGDLRTWLISTRPQILPQGDQRAVETHSCAEEMYMLAGELTSPYGVMSQGAYFWRPRETFHGPFGSREGGWALLRFRDGDQRTVWHDRRISLDFDMPYLPMLPPNLQHLSKYVPAHRDRF